jgi:Ca2+-binding EF-hand superfamily protein
MQSVADFEFYEHDWTDECHQYASAPRSTGEVDFDEFLLLMDRKMKESAENIEETGVLEVFNVFDKDGNGVISRGVAKFCT